MSYEQRRGRQYGGSNRGRPQSANWSKGPQGARPPRFGQRTGTRKETQELQRETGPAPVRLETESKVEKILTKKDLRTMEASSASTSPQTFQAVQPWLGTTATNDQIANLVADMVVADMIGQSNGIIDEKQTVLDDSKLSPASYKAYLFWALASYIKHNGLLRGAYAYQLLEFPKNLIIPKAWARYIWYHGKYFYEGAEYHTSMNLAAAPAWNSDGVHEVGTGLSMVWSYTAAYKYRTMQMSPDATYYEEVFSFANTVTSCSTFDIMIQYSASFSQRIAATGFGVEFGKIPAHAPDGSAYAIVQDSLALYDDALISFHTDDFDADIASILGTNYVNGTYTSTGLPFVKSPRACKIENPTAAQSSYGSEARARAFVYVANRMSNPLEPGWNFNGYKLKTFVAEYKPIKSGPLWGMIHMCIKKIQEARYGWNTGAFSARTVAAAIAMMSGALFRRCGSFRPRGMGKYWQAWMPPKMYDGLKLPVPFAACVEEIGPVIIKEQLVVPYLYSSDAACDASYVDATSNVDWFAFISAAQTYANYACNNFWAANQLKSSVTVAFSYYNVTVNAAFIAGMANRVAFPYIFFNDVNNYYTDMMQIPEFGDFFVSTTASEFGTAVNLTDSVIAVDTLNLPDTLVSEAGVAAITWNWFVFPTRIASAIPLAGRDLLVAIIINSARNDGALANTYPHGLVIGSKSLTAQTLLSEFIKSLGTPGGSNVVALAEEKEKIKVKTAKIGSLALELVDPNQCRSYWCKVADDAMTDAIKSLSMDTDGGNAYLKPKVFSEILHNSKDVVYQQTTGELTNVIKEGGKSILKGMAENAIPMLLEAFL